MTNDKLIEVDEMSIEHKFERADYTKLNAKQKEIYNFQRVSAVFAEFGFTTIKLQDDWQGADFIAISFDGKKFFKVQLKGRMALDKKYLGKDLYICFQDRKSGSWYLYPHDKIYNELSSKFTGRIWSEMGSRNWAKVTKDNMKRLEPYKISEELK